MTAGSKSSRDLETFPYGRLGFNHTEYLLGFFENFIKNWTVYVFLKNLEKIDQFWFFEKFRKNIFFFEHGVRVRMGRPRPAPRVRRCTLKVLLQLCNILYIYLMAKKFFLLKK